MWDQLPPAIHSQWARALIQIRVARLLAYRTVRAQETGETPDVMASAARIAVTQCDQQVAELLFQMIDDESLESGAGAPLHGAIEDHWRYAQAATVASGTIEVQRMIVSKALLGGRQVNPVLPDEAIEFGGHGHPGLRRPRAAWTPPAAPRTTTSCAATEVGKTLRRAGHRRPRRTRRRRLPRCIGRPLRSSRSSRPPVPGAPPPCCATLTVGRSRWCPTIGARVDHGDLFPTWRVATMGGVSSEATPTEAAFGTRLGPFVADLATEALTCPLPAARRGPAPHPHGLAGPRHGRRGPSSSPSST